MAAEPRVALEDLEWMLGTWRVEGRVDGRAVRGEARIHRGVEGSVIEARERILRADGSLDYEDLAIYCWDDGARLLRVYHFSAPSRVERYTVLPLDGRPGLHWMRSDLAARVVITPAEGGWRAEVWLGAEAEPASALRYSPASSSTAMNQPAS